MSGNSFGSGPRPAFASHRNTAASAKAARPAFSCTECGASVAKWAGRCPQCQAWGSLSEAGASRALLRRATAGPVSARARPIGEIDARAVTHKPSGVAEFDRVLGGGFTPGGVILLAGEPGVGKSTLLLAAAKSWADGGTTPALIVTGEESVEQVRLRADRMEALSPRLFLAAESDLSAVLTHMDEVRPGLLIVDSVQTISMAEADGAAGGVNQVRAVASALSAACKERGIACVLVGHVTKDGAIAGPRVLEHLVDVVLHFEGDHNSPLRMMRGIKNRFGPSDEIGCFRMTGDGIVGLADPSEIFLSGRRTELPGTCSTVSLQGRRPVPIELQTLVVEAAGDAPRRTLSGLDGARFALVLAVLARWGGVRLAKHDVLAATVGGARLVEPAADLPLALALASSARDTPLPSGLVAFGEIGLAAEIRPVPGLERRLAEAARLGFERALIPAGVRVSAVPGLKVIPVQDLGEALRLSGHDDGVTTWLRRGATRHHRPGNSPGLSADGRAGELVGESGTVMRMPSS